MAEDVTRARLGRGLAALLGDVDDEPVVPAADGAARAGSRRVPIEFIRRNARNPRSSFAEDELDELAASIRERGIIQPIVVRPFGALPDVYEIIAGERRWRAAQRAGLHDVPVVVVEADDRLALELAIIENVQRTDLDAIDEARGYQHLVAEHGYTQNDLAGTVGKSRSHIANTIRLLKLPETVQRRISSGELTAGHGRALLAFPDPDRMADRIVRDGLNVRDVEQAAQEAQPPQAAPRKPRQRDPETAALEDDLASRLGLRVRIDRSGEAGEVRIRYSSAEQLEELARTLRAHA